MGERPEIDRMIEEEAKKLAPDERHHEPSADIGKMINETLAEGSPSEENADQPVDSAIRPLTVAEYRSTNPRHVQEAADKQKEEEARLELDRATKASKGGVDITPGIMEPSGLELDDRRSSAKMPTSARRERPDESMGDVLSKKKADARPPMDGNKKKKGLLSWLRGE